MCAAFAPTVDSLKSAARDDKTSAQVRVLQAGLENVKSGLNATKTETSSAVAQLNTKLDKIEHEPAPKIQQVIERLGKLEKATNLDTAATGSIASPNVKTASAIPTPPSKPAPVKAAAIKLASAEAAPKDTHLDEAVVKPTVVPGYVVRDVYEGVALIEGRRGPMEVVPGVSIPGAGVVEIDRASRQRLDGDHDQGRPRLRGGAPRLPSCQLRPALPGLPRGFLALRSDL